MVKEIELTKGYKAIVDDSSFETLSCRKWLAMVRKNRDAVYAYTSIKSKTVLMHRFLMNPPPDMQVDHINGDGLDNRLSNLRICTHAQNQWNQKKIRGASRYKGVSRRGRKWYSYIWLSDKHIYLGTYETQEEAALSYNKKAIELFGEFASLNQIATNN